MLFKRADAKQRFLIDPTERSHRKYFGALEFALPVESFSAVGVWTTSLLEWLKDPAGLFIDSHNMSHTGNWLSLAICVDPKVLYPNDGEGVEGKAHIGVVYRGARMPTLRFSQVYDKLVSWLGTDSSVRLRKPCVMLVQIDITGEFIPMCDPYPILLDFVSKEARKESGCFDTDDLRAFRIHLVDKVSLGLKVTVVYVPRFHGEEDVMNPRVEVRLPKNALEGCVSSTGKNGKKEVTAVTIPVAKPDVLHWSYAEDLKFKKFLYEVSSERAARVKATPKKASTQPELIELDSAGTAPPPKTKSVVSSTGAAKVVTKSTVTSTTTSEGGPVTRSRKPPVAQSDYSVTMIVEGEEVSEEGGSLLQTATEQARENREELDRIEADRILNVLNGLNAQALIQMGQVRILDRNLANGLMAEFARLHAIVNDKLALCLQAFHDKASGTMKDLKGELSRTLSGIRDPSLLSRVDQIIEDHTSEIDTMVMLPMLQVTKAHSELESFMKIRLQEASTCEDTRVMIDSLLESLSAHTSRVKEALRDPAMRSENVAMYVFMTMSMGQQHMTNHFMGVLEGLMSSMVAFGGEESGAQSVSEACKSQLVDALRCSLRGTPQQDADFEDSDIDFDSLMSVRYSFESDRPHQVSPIFESSQLPSLMKAFTQSYGKTFPVPTHPAPVKLVNTLWEKFRKSEPCSKDRMHLHLLNVLASRLHEQWAEVRKGTQNFSVEKEEGEVDKEAPMSKLRPGQTSKGKLQGPKSVREAKEKNLEKKAVKEGKVDAKAAQGGASKVETAKPSGIEDPTKVISGASKDGKTSMTFTSLSRENVQGHMVNITRPKYQPFVDLGGVTTAHKTTGESEVTTVLGVKIPDSTPGSQPFSPVQPLNEIGVDGLPIVPEDKASGQQAGSSSTPGKPPIGASGSKKEAEEEGERDADDEEDDDEEDDDDDEDDEDEETKGEEPPTAKKPRLEHIGGIPLDTLSKSRAIAHASASKLCKTVRGLVMGLPDGRFPTDKEVENSDMFEHVGAAVRIHSPRDVSPEMIQTLESLGHLATSRFEKLDLARFKIAIYAWDCIRTIHPEVLKAYEGTKAENDPRLIIVIPPSITSVRSTYGLDELFTISCLKRQTISRGPGKHAKQISFCLFCGVHGGNFESCMSHVRVHLGLHFVCGGCFGASFKAPEQYNEHRKACPAHKTAEESKGTDSAKKTKKKKNKKEKEDAAK